MLWGIQELVEEFWRVYAARCVEYEGYREQTKAQCHEWAAAHAKVATTLTILYAIVYVLVVRALIVALYNYVYALVW